MTKTTRPRPARQCEIAADEGYNLAGAPVLLAKLTSYVGRATFAQLAAIATATQGEYSRHLSAFMWPADCHAARESFAAQARVILSNPPPIPPAVTAARARRSAAGHAIDTAPSQERPAAWTAYAAACADEARIVAESDPHDWPDTPLEISYGRTVIHRTAGEAPGQVYTDTPTAETPPAIRVSVRRPIAHTVTDRTPIGYGPTQPSLL